jgi:hypothetical protein
MVDEVSAVGVSDDSGSRSDQATKPQRRRRAMTLRVVVTLVIGGIGVAYAWHLRWERNHPAAAVARTVGQGNAAARIQAIHEVEWLGRDDPEVAIPALMRAMDDPDAQVAAAAASALFLPTRNASTDASALADVGNAVQAVMKSLKDKRPEVRAAAAQTLWMLALSWSGPNALLDRRQVYDRLVEAAGDADAGVRLAALSGMGAVPFERADDPPSVVVAAMEDESPKNRAAAALALVRFRRGLPRVVPKFLRSLEATHPEKRAKYLEVLGTIRAPQFSADAVPAHVAMLASGDAEVRALAATALMTFHDEPGRRVPKEVRPFGATEPIAFKTAPTEAIGALVQCLSDARGSNAVVSEPSGRELMAAARERVGRQRVPESKDAVVVAAKALGQFAPGTEQAGEAIAALGKLLKTGTAEQRIAAARALGRFYIKDSPPAEPGQSREVSVPVAALTQAIADAEAPVRVAALDGLNDMEHMGRFATSRDLDTAIENALKDPIPECRIHAAWVIAHYGTIVDRYIPALIRLAEHDPNEEVRSACSGVISLDSGPFPAQVTPAIVPALVEALSSSDGALRISVCRLLGHLGEAARPAIPALIRALESAAKNRGYDDDREAAANALGQIAPETTGAPLVIAALARALKPDDSALTGSVASVLGRFGASAAPALPDMARVLREAMQQKRQRTAVCIGIALTEVDPHSPAAIEAVPALVGALRRPDGSVDQRSRAAEALGAIGPAASEAVPELAALLKRNGRTGRPRTADRANVARALGQVAQGTSQAELAISGLIDAVHEAQKWPGDEGNAEVIDALGQFGAQAAIAKPELSELAKVKNAQVSATARKALRRIEGSK